jgi:flagellar basal body P-ring formation protein FlgA
MRVLAVLAALAVATPALAGQPVTLKADPSDADGLVTLGDLFDGAGAAGKAALAVRSGTSVMLDALAVQAAARRAGLDWPNAEGLRRIVVRAAGAGGSAEMQRGNVDVLTWARSIAAGEVVQPQDLIWAKAALAPADAPSDPDALIGMAARRPLRAGGVATVRDVSALQVVKSGEVITLSFEAEGISLALQAKALSGGAPGDTINVLNVASKKTVQAVVVGPGQAVVGPAADQLKLSRSSRIAAR